jgi:Mg-chelatase subunit ChlD
MQCGGDVKQRSWISLIGSCILLALGAALAFAVIIAGASVALAGHQASDQVQNASPSAPAAITVSGMLTDSRCGARHRRNSHMSPAECTRACLRSGSSYLLVDGERRYTLAGNTAELGDLLGTRVNVTGTLAGDRIVVSSASPLP